MTSGHSDASLRQSEGELRKHIFLIEGGMAHKAQFTIKQSLIGWSGALLLRALRYSLRWRAQGLYPNPPKHWAEEEPVILAFWHSQQLLMPWVYIGLHRRRKKRYLYALASIHNDGRYAAAVMKSLGVGTIAGSSTRGGRKAFSEMVRAIRNGNHIGITPDGPKGPPEKVKSGVLKLASLTGAPIVPVALGADRKWVFRSWDELFLPKPGARALLLMGEKMFLPRELSKEELEKAAEDLAQKIQDLNQEVRDYLQP